MLLFIDNARHANIMRHRKDRNEKLFSCMHFFLLSSGQTKTMK